MSEVISDVPAIEVRQLSKRYGPVRALTGVNVAIAPGMVHALVGENGAGKSTLGKILSGVVSSDAGDVYRQGRPVNYASPLEARKDGVVLVAQELALLPTRTVLDNVLLGNETWREAMFGGGRRMRRYRNIAQEVGFDLSASRQVQTLRLADQQKVEILHALISRPEVIILDEPTAALPPEEASALWRVVHALKDAGSSVVLISHFLADVLNHADRVTVMRDGSVVSDRPTAEHSERSLIEDMLGRSLSSTFPPRRKNVEAPPALELRNVSTDYVHGVDLSLCPGEIVGLAGLLGSGRSEVGRAIFGADRIRSGELLLDGKAHRFRRVSEAIAQGIAMVPESRRNQGLVPVRSVHENLTLPSLAEFSTAGVIRPNRERQSSRQLLRRIGVRENALGVNVAALSGGNQQKVLLGKWMSVSPKVLVVDEPTRGVDIGSKQAIYQLLSELADEGTAILVISSELEEILGLANRLYVMRARRIAGELSGGASEHDVLGLAFGVHHAEST